MYTYANIVPYFILTIFLKMPGATRKIEIEKQREELQQQKLKLQLQQQQVMQEHLQLQFDALNNDMNKKTDESYSDEYSKPRLYSPTLESNDIKFTDLSSGVLSDDARTIDANESDEAGAGAGKVSEDLQSDPSRTEESGVDINFGRPDGLNSIQKSLSEDEFVPVPRVPYDAVFRAPPQPLPLHFAKSTGATIGIDKLASAEIPLTMKSSSQPSSSGQYNVGALINQPRLGVPYNEQWKGQRSLHVSPPHDAIPAPLLPEEAIPSPKALLGTVDPMQQPEPPVVHDNRRPFAFPTTEDIPPEISHERAVISDSNSPFFHIPTAISSTPFLPGGPATFQFPENRETDTASYLHFYQQQLLEQQNRIREQQKAIQERQQKRLEQLKQFQERLRRQRNITGLGNFENIPAERSRHATGQWQSLQPTSRYTLEDSSSSTSHAKLNKESFDGDISHGVQTGEASPSLNQSKVEARKLPVSEGLVSDTSSSPSRHSSELISVKDNNTSIHTKPSDLGLWSDSTPHVSSCDPTKSSSSTLDDSKSGKRVDEQPRPKILHEFGISSSTLNNNNHGKYICRLVFHDDFLI